ncbi:MAG: NAD(P)H-dependent oxidoreductase [Pseudomonadales bacterium]|nr:NAD(P)H-dependent oxidoreductase [Pseudomonadales bacterium]
MRILYISGSVRAASTNTILLSALCERAPTGVDVSICRLGDQLPIYDQDMEGARHSRWAQECH